MFLAGKAWEPIRNTIGYPKTNVKLVATHAGINVGPDGVTHQAVEDIALMRAIPGMTVLAPTDANQVLPALQAAMEIKGPVYVRLERAAIPLLTDPQMPVSVGKSLLLRDGVDATIFAVGSMATTALKAAENLSADGVDTRVISMVSLKPIDEDAIAQAARETGAIVTAEDHNCFGGLGGAVAEVLARSVPVPLEQVAVDDVFAESGTANQLHEKYHLTATDITQAVHRAIARGNDSNNGRISA
jgi:transketolase